MATRRDLYHPRTTSNSNSFISTRNWSRKPEGKVATTCSAPWVGGRKRSISRKWETTTSPGIIVSILRLWRILALWRTEYYSFPSKFLKWDFRWHGSFSTTGVKGMKYPCFFWFKVKIQHYVPPFNPNPRQRLTIIADPKYALPIYNELFRALAWHGRDAEFLSLWDEAKSSMSVHLRRTDG